MASYPGMERWRGKTALVTGASCGIGYETSKQLARLGLNVVGCARNVEKIQALSEELSSAPGKLLAVRCDVRKEEDVQAAFEAAKDKFGGIDVCISNAGLAHNAPLLSGSTSDWKEMAEVNIVGMCICAREFVQRQKARGIDEGHIILMNSMSGHRLTKSLFFYGATKFATTAITEGIRRELRDMKSNIKVTSVSPGLVRTEFRGRSMKADDMEQAKKDYDTFGVVLEAEDIAEAVIYILSTPPRMQIHDILVRPTTQVF